MKILAKQFDLFHQHQYILGIDPAITLDTLNLIPDFSCSKQDLFPFNDYSSIRRNTIYVYILGSLYEINTLYEGNNHSIKYLSSASEFLKNFAKKNHKPIFFFQLDPKKYGNDTWSVNLAYLPFDELIHFSGHCYIPFSNLFNNNPKEFNKYFNSLDFYNDCYNFLIECSQDKETIIEVDNNTKVEQHGFDLKISFRHRK